MDYYYHIVDYYYAEIVVVVIEVELNVVGNYDEVVPIV